jgi:hypothetical protein
MDFTNREIATYFWLSTFIVISMIRRDVRKAAWNVLKLFFAPKLLRLWASIAAYVVGSVWLFSQCKLWQWDNLKTTVLWAVSFVFIAVLDIMKISTEEDERKFFTKILRDTLALSAVLTFLVELQSFSLTTEMIAVPLLALLGLLQAVAQHDAKTAQVDRLLKVILSIAGLWYIGYSLYESVLQFRQTATAANLREFGIPILLTITFVPFLYGLLILVTYEGVFIRLTWQIKDQQLRSRAKLEALVWFGPRLNLLRRWASNVGSVQPDDIGKLRRSFNDAIQTVRDEKSPPYIKPSEGWSPHLARYFLRQHGLEARPYHRDFEDEWSASSPMLSIWENRGIANNMAYYLTGTERVAKSLKLRLYINRPEEQAVADEQFLRAGNTLLEMALGETDATTLIGSLATLNPFGTAINGTQVSLSGEDWSVGIAGSFERTLHLQR